MATSVTTVEAKENFSEIVNHVVHHKERVVLTRRGKEIAAIIPIDDLKFLQLLQDKLDLEEATAALQEVREKGAITLDILKSQGD